MNKIKYFAKLFSFLMSLVVSIPLFSCAGFFNTLSRDTQEVFKDAAPSSFTTELKCQGHVAYTVTSDTKTFQLCIPCTLTSISIQSMVDMFPEESVKTIESQNKVEVNEVMIYHPQSFQDKPEVLGILNEEIKKLITDLKNIQPFVEHKGIASCPGFEKDASLQAVGEDKVPENCMNCYERMVLQETGRKLPYLMLVNSSQRSKGGSAFGADFKGVHRVALNLGTQEHAENLLSTIPAGRTVNCLLIFGDHGLNGSLFGKGPDTWRKSVIEPLRKKNFKAHTIILDACFSASMIPAFIDLLTDDGIIVGGVSYVSNPPLTRKIMQLMADEKISDLKAVKTAIINIKQEEAPIAQGELPVILNQSPVSLLKKMSQQADIPLSESVIKIYELVKKVDREETKENKIELYTAIKEFKDEKNSFKETEGVIQEWKKLSEEEFIKKNSFFFGKIFVKMAQDLLSQPTITLPSMYGIYFHQDKTFRYDQTYEMYDRLLIDIHQGTPFLPVDDLWSTIKSLSSGDKAIKFALL